MYLILDLEPLQQHFDHLSLVLAVQLKLIKVSNLECFSKISLVIWLSLMCVTFFSDHWEVRKYLHLLFYLLSIDITSIFYPCFLETICLSLIAYTDLEGNACYFLFDLHQISEFLLLMSVYCYTKSRCVLKKFICCMREWKGLWS